MSRQYKREYELIISPENEESKSIKDLRCRFEITKSVLSFPNLCQFTLINPNEDTLSKLRRRFTRVTINLGYEGNLGLAFKGEIRNVFQNRSGTDLEVTFYAADGERDWQNTYINKTYADTVTVKSVIEDVLSEFRNLTVGFVDGLPDVPDKLRGQSLSGAAKDILDNYADEYGFDWNIQDNEVVITPIETPVPNGELVIINSATGMINSPTITEIGADVTTLLNPRLLPNTEFEIESLNANIQVGNLFFRQIKRTSGAGRYKTQEVRFIGDSRDGDWLSTVKGRYINV